MNVPAVPRIADDVVERHGAEHEAFAAALRSAANGADRAFRYLQHRLVVESLAYVQPVLSRPLDQLLRPPPRAFLTRTQELRLVGARAAFRHLDSRVAMHQLSAVPSVLHPTTPFALHALLEGPTPSGRETNPGMLRATPTAWRPESNSFMHPPAQHCEELVAEALAVAGGHDAPACVRAGWLTFTMLSIHPFVDGNGRTSRALYLAVAADELPLGIDWGILEQWSVARYHYVEALQAGQQVERYDGAAMDARPFVQFSLDASLVGLDLCRRRLEMLEAELVGLSAIGLTPNAALVLVAVRSSVQATTDELSALGLSAVELDGAIAELGESGLMAWRPRPSSRRTMLDPSAHGLVATGP